MEPEIKAKHSIGRKALIAVAAVIFAVVVFFAVMVISTKQSSSPVGYWVIKEAASSDVTMTQTDAEAMGFTEIGSVRLDKSGSCKVTILGEEYDGEWTQDEEGAITITYGEEKSLTAAIGEDGVMTAADDSSVEYTLEK